jgi:hypothetical protein
MATCLIKVDEEFNIFPYESRSSMFSWNAFFSTAKFVCTEVLAILLVCVLEEIRVPK